MKTNQIDNRPIIHRDLAVLQVSDADLLERLYLDPQIRPHLWFRLDERRVLIPSSKASVLTRALKAHGVSPSVLRKMVVHGDA